MTDDLHRNALDLLGHEALFLDMQRWDDWLDLYRPDAVFWMPAWKDQTSLSSDPDSEISLFYCETRAALEDRVWRLKQRSAASTPLLRTVHSTSNVLAIQRPGDTVDLFASWVCHAFNPKRNSTTAFFGRSEYAICTESTRWRIRRKKAILMNDYIPTLMDFYCC